MQRTAKTTKITFDEALEMLAEDRTIEACDVRADALRRFVWLAEWHVPGCLSESRAVCLTKADALANALDFIGDDVRGARADLLRYGSTNRVSPDAYVRNAITTIRKHRLCDLI